MLCDLYYPSCDRGMWMGNVARWVCQYMPERCFVALGKLSYRHIA